MDIANLKKEIGERKKQLETKRGVLGEQISTKKQSGDQFLRELLHSSRTGEETNASKKIKVVDKIAESKLTGKEVDPNILDHIAKPSVNAPKFSPQKNQATNLRSTTNQGGVMMEEREIPNITTRNNSGLSEVIEQYAKTPYVGNPMGNNNTMLTEQQMLEKMGYYRTNNGMNQLNEQLLKSAQDMLNENFGKLFGEAMKNSIIETYKSEVIKEAINENRSFIEQIVRETIIDLQKKAQSRK